jgi:anti-anti-sigma regulatory factor
MTVEIGSKSTGLSFPELESDIVGRVSGILIGSTDVDMYADVLDLVRTTFESRFGFFGYIDEDGALVCPSMTREIFGACNVLNKSIVFPRSSWGGLWGRILLEKRALYKNGLHRVPEGHLPLHNSLGAPLIHQGELLGSIHIANREAGYTDLDLHLMKRIASVIAPVLAARLQRDRQDAKRREAEAALKEHVRELARINGELEKANAQVRAQMQQFREHSTPVIQVWNGVLVTPLVGQLDVERMNQLLSRLLDIVANSGSKVVLIDITGLPIVDTQTAQLLFSATSAVRLLGAQVVLTGARPRIAQTMVELGLDFSSLVTRGSLASGLEFAFKLLQLRVVSAE